MLFNTKYLKTSIKIFFLLSLFFVIIDLLILSNNIQNYNHQNLILNQVSNINNNFFTLFNIFIHNLMILLIIIILGNLSFGLGTLVLILYNLFYISFKVVNFYIITGSKFAAIMSILSHGVLELYAISLAIDLSLVTIRMFFIKNLQLDSTQIKLFAYKLFLSILCLLFAAIIEVNVSPHIINLFLKNY